MSKAWAGGSTPAWRKIRAYVLARDKYQCQLRTDVCTTTATQVHHTHGRAATGDDPQYLCAACQPCNVKIGDPTRAPDPPGRGLTRW